MRFWKWHALGNSYLVVEEPLDPGTARRLCDVRYGIGADGVLAIEGEDVVIWNPDGSRAEFSGNGTRIAASWLMERSGGGEVEVRVDGRVYAARRRPDGLVEMPVGEAEVGELETLEVDGRRIELNEVSVGNPHAVARGDYGRDDLLRLGPLIEGHDRFPLRTNVQLVRVDGPNEVSALVWERGAGETTASGSSAVAVAAAAIANGWCESPVTVHMPGGDLLVELDEENRVTLVGPAEQICEGELRLDG